MDKTLKRFRNYCLGWPAIVAGSGPSLRHIKPEDTKGFVVIAVNSAINKFPKAGYFVSADPRIVLYREWETAKASTARLILARPKGMNDWHRYDKHLERPYDDCVEDRITHVWSRLTGKNLSFDLHDDTDLVFGHSSAFTACHWAHLIGCSPIILVGCDCGPEDGKYLFCDFPGQEQYADRLLKDSYAELIQPANTPILESFEKFWYLIGQENPTVDIRNCGNANIPTIQTADLTSLLSEDTPKT